MIDQISNIYGLPIIKYQKWYKKSIHLPSPTIPLYQKKPYEILLWSIIYQISDKYGLLNNKYDLVGQIWHIYGTQISMVCRKSTIYGALHIKYIYFLKRLWSMINQVADC